MVRVIRVGNGGGGRGRRCRVVDRFIGEGRGFWGLVFRVYFIVVVSFYGRSLFVYEDMRLK